MLYDCYWVPIQLDLYTKILRNTDTNMYAPTNTDTDTGHNDSKTIRIWMRDTGKK